jgi:hypothetical protein
MMLRQKALNEGDTSWEDITQKSVRKYAWIEGVGLRASFTYYGMSVKRIDFKSEDRRETLISMLSQYPEGVEIYDRSIPHAVLLTRYDADEDIFYCADPALSENEMALGDSWMKTLFSGAGQEDILKGVDCVWVISSYGAADITDEDEGEKSDDITVVPSDTPDDSKVTDGISDSDSDDSTEQEEDKTETVDEPAAEETPITPVKTASFVKIYSYSESAFSDVDPSAWYISYVENVYETGLMSGVSDRVFDLNGNVTLAQSITIASRIYSRYADDNESFTAKNGESWFDPYLRYASEHGIVASKYTSASNVNIPVTRAQFAEIISGAVEETDCTAINTIKNGKFSDISESNAAGRAVYRLCRAGIITGDDSGNFNPDNSISRVQMAAILARITDPDLRVKL